jgi:hypothetical protein|tara:strand:- start:752 stop:1051 length:300 start_codon:yes stop_codon:yes gene_type:complete
MLKKVNDSFDARTEPMVYKIEKNVPMPTWYRNSTGYRGQFPFELMKKNDSFFIPCASILQDKTGTKVHQASTNYRRIWNKDFKGAYRSVTGGIRFWRTN